MTGHHVDVDTVGECGFCDRPQVALTAGLCAACVPFAILDAAEAWMDHPTYRAGLLQEIALIVWRTLEPGHNLFRGRAAVITPGRVQWHDTNGSRYGQAALDASLSRIMSAEVGNRNNTVNAVAYSLGRLVAAGHLDRDTASGALTGAGVDIGLTHLEASTTVRSGLMKGMEHPALVPDRGPERKPGLPRAPGLPRGRSSLPRNPRIERP